MTSLFVVFVDDGIAPTVVGVFAGESSADDYVKDLAERLADAGVSARVRRLPLIASTAAIDDVVEAMFEQRSAELRRLSIASGSEGVQGEATIG